MLKIAPDIEIRQVSHPIIGLLQHAHCSAVNAVDDSSVLVAYFHAIKEAHRTQAIYGRWFSDDLTPKGDPFVLSKDIKNFRMEGNPVLWKSPDDNRLFLFYVTSWGGWSTCILRYKYSEDGGKTWSKSRKIYSHISRVSKNPPIRLSNGDYLLPATVEFRECTPLFYISKDKGMTWQDTGARLTVPEKYWPESVRTGKGKKNKKIAARMLDQPTIIQRSDGSIYCLMRAYRPLGRMFESVSKDNGYTWSEPRPSKLPNPDGGFAMLRLSSGAVAIIYNHSSTQRNPLSVALSDDEARTWSFRRNLMEYHPDPENDRDLFVKECIKRFYEKNGIELDEEGRPADDKGKKMAESKKFKKELSEFISSELKEWISKKKEGDIIGPENFQYPTFHQDTSGKLHCTWSHGYSKIVNGRLVSLTDIQYTVITEEWIRESIYKDDEWLL